MTQIDTGGLQGALEQILGGYVAARSERFGKRHPLWSAFGTAKDTLQYALLSSDREAVEVRFSLGQGTWATIPWIACLDRRETRKTSRGFYVVYLFRADMSAVYLALSQGTSWLGERLTAEDELRLRRWAAQMRERESIRTLGGSGFSLTDHLDLGSERTLPRAYEKATVVSKRYDRGAVPRSDDLLRDFTTLVSAYCSVVPSNRFIKWDRLD